LHEEKGKAKKPNIAVSCLFNLTVACQFFSLESSNRKSTFYDDERDHQQLQHIVITANFTEKYHCGDSAFGIYQGFQ